MVKSWLTGLVLGAVAGVAWAQQAPEPNPPRAEMPQSLPAVQFDALAGAAATTEWVFHKSANGQHPDGEEQMLLWLMNRARQDPTAEGLWLATSNEAAIAGGRNYFGVNTSLLQSEFAGYSAKPPAAFDRRLYEAAKQHSDYLIANDAQNHNNQLARIVSAGFDYVQYRGSVFSYADNGFNAHAAFNIDWGNAPDGMQASRGHRKAIMSLDGDYTNVGIAGVEETSVATDVGQLVVTANYCKADTSTANHYNRFIVGTVWQDSNGNGRYDPGEGFGGVTVTPDAGSFFAITAPGGGYAIPVISASSYQLTFSGGGIGADGSKSVTVGSVSALLDFFVGVDNVGGGGSNISADGFEN